MGKTIISKGRNIEEAINLGLAILKSTREEVLVEVIQKEKKGVWGARLKPAIVKLTKVEKRQVEDFNHHRHTKGMMNDPVFASHAVHTEKEPQENPEHFLQDELEGKVWVKDGKIFYKQSPLHYPTVTVGKGIKLFKNDQLVTGTTIVTETDRFEIKTDEEKIIETKWGITVDENKLNAILHVEPGMKKSFVIKDIPPDYHIELNAEEQIEIRNDLQYQQILRKLKELNVVRGFDFIEISKAIKTKKADRFVIARGIKPREGKNGWVELKINLDNQQEGPRLREDGTVDFRELKNIPSVRKGQVIAVVHSPIPGTPGVTVTNEPLPPEPTYPVVVQLGKGVAAVEDGTKIVATERGRPHLEQNGMLVKVSIMEKFTHRGDVNIASGNIRFKGDIDILGNVEDGMSVEAEGNITVFQNVNRANIMSKQAIFVRQNVIGSTISSGKSDTFVFELIRLLSVIEEQMEKFILSVKNLMASSRFKTTENGLFPFINLLLSEKFRLLATTAKQYIKVCERGVGVLDRRWTDLAKQFRLCFFSHTPNESHSFEQLTVLLSDIKGAMDKHRSADGRNSYVELMYALNSTIYCSGDVAVLGQGCYNCKIHAGGFLTINGVMRGGEAYAQYGAAIKETGSEIGVPTYIVVPSDQTIQIGLAKEGTMIQIGKVKYSFQKERSCVKAALNEEGQIVFL
ncbi:FapA family protein [Parageobacillus sp. KH3-4]|uniref:FapA family protein n=1 Tax=Parageobacillus sp. KH3-4 TaxID=2916802 RepID=UPI001FCC8926|nr:FapA family protein [Parageobacillus sp. KH3-4]BDG46910.1 hypothetical protein PspKH34_14710 [Parageobacillus sp. KH3-4]